MQFDVICCYLMRHYRHLRCCRVKARAGGRALDLRTLVFFPRVRGPKHPQHYDVDHTVDNRAGSVI